MTQILKKYATLVAADNDWRMVRRPNDVNVNGYTLVRELQFMDAIDADNFAALLDAQTTITNPVVDGQPWSGTFANSKTTPKQGAFDDRSITVENELIKVLAIANLAALVVAAVEYEVTQKNEFLRPFATDYGENDLIAFVYRGINPASRSICMGLADADLEDPAKFTPIGDNTWTYLDREFKDQPDGTATFTIGFRKISWAADAEVRKDKTISAFETRTVLTASKESSRETEQGSQFAGTLKTTSSVEDEFTNFNNTLETRTAMADADVDNNQTRTAFETNGVVTARNEAARETAEVAQVAGSIVTTESKKNDFKRFDNSLRTRTAVADADVRNDNTINPFETKTVLTARHEVARETEETVQGDGTLVTTRSEKNDFEAFDNSLETRTAVKNVASGTDMSHSKFESSEVVKVTHNDNAITATQSDGVIVDARNQLDEFGEYSTSLATRTANKNVASGTDASENVFESSTVVKVTHDDTVETHPFVDGTVVGSVGNRMDEFGEFSTDKTTRTAKLAIVSGTDATENLFETKSTAKVVHGPAVTPTFSTGVSIETVGNTKDEFGVFSTQKETRTRKAVASSQKQYTDTAEYAETITENEHQTAGIGDTTQTNGSLLVNSDTKDEFGAYRTRGTVRVFGDDTNGVSTHTAVKTSKYTTKRTRYRHAATRPQLTEKYGALNVHKDAVTGRWVGTKDVTTYNDDFLWVQPVSQTGLTKKFVQTQTDPKVTTEHYEGTKWREWTYTYDLRYNSSESTAYLRTKGTLGGPHMKSRVWRTATGLYASIKITAISIGNWTTGNYA